VSPQLGNHNGNASALQVSPEKRRQRKLPYSRQLILQGGVTSGILNALVAEDLPGPGTVFLGVEWKFLKAVGVGELITGRVEIKEVPADKPICKIETSLRNEAGDICLSGTATVYMSGSQSE
jgi:acyl dehydratase